MILNYRYGYVNKKERVKKIIVNRGSDKAPMLITNKERKIPLPWDTSKQFENGIEVDLHLESSRGGGARWYIEGLSGEEKEKIKTLGKYEPKIVCKLMNPTIIFSRQKTGDVWDYFNYKGKAFVQEYSWGYDNFTSGWRIDFDSLITLNSSELLYSKILDISNDCLKPRKEVGDLKVYCLNNSQDDFFEEETKTFRKEFFKYQIFGGEIIDVIRKGEYCFALVNFFRDKSYIADPENILSTITLEKPPKWCVLKLKR